jgi:hypothetical protein
VDNLQNHPNPGRCRFASTRVISGQSSALAAIFESLRMLVQRLRYWGRPARLARPWWAARVRRSSFAGDVRLDSCSHLPVILELRAALLTAYPVAAVECTGVGIRWGSLTSGALTKARVLVRSSVIRPYGRTSKTYRPWTERPPSMPRQVFER